MVIWYSGVLIQDISIFRRGRTRPALFCSYKRRAPPSPACQNKSVTAALSRHTEDSLHLGVRVNCCIVRRRDRVFALRVRVVRTEVYVGTRDALNALDIGVYDRVAKEVQVQIILWVWSLVIRSTYIR